MNVSFLERVQMQKEDYLSKAREFGVSENVIQAIEPMMRSIGTSFPLIPNQELPCPTACSKFGGYPDAPTGARWPEEADGSPYVFIAQINLTEISGTGSWRSFPVEGLLSFFACFETKKDYVEKAKVLFTATTNDMQELPLHDMLPAMDVPVAMRMQILRNEYWVAPRQDSAWFQKLPLSDDEKYTFEDFEYELDTDINSGLIYQHSRFLGGLLSDIGGGDEFAKEECERRLRGLPSNQRVPDEHKERSGGWRILALFDPFDAHQPQDSPLKRLLGRRLFYWIHDADIAKGNFENVQLISGES